MEPVRRVWTQAVDGDAGHVDAAVEHTHRLPVGAQSALLLVPNPRNTPPPPPLHYNICVYRPHRTYVMLPVVSVRLFLYAIF